jgi:hypothetical protein
MSIQDHLQFSRSVNYATCPANSAQSFVFAVGGYFYIVAGKFMTVFAVSLAMIKTAYAVTAMLIYLACNRLNVRRIHAMANAAKMIALQFIGNRFDNHLINKSVRGIVKMGNDPKFPITVRGYEALPFPTRHIFVEFISRYFNFGKDSGKQFSIVGKLTCSFHALGNFFFDNLGTLSFKNQTAFAVILILYSPFVGYARFAVRVKTVFINFSSVKFRSVFNGFARLAELGYNLFSHFYSPYRMNLIKLERCWSHRFGLFYFNNKLLQTQDFRRDYYVTI